MIMKKIYLIVLLGTLLFTSKRVQAQDVITGIVKDESGQGLPGATVVEKGTNKFASTDIDGKFSIPAAKVFPFTIQINITGFQQQEIEVYELTTEAVEVVLKTANMLDELVVIGYGEQKRKDITGSVASVPIEIKSQPVVSVERLLQGSVAGAVVTQTSGQPGGGVSVQIRGNNSITAGSDPLYVIDGFPINNDYSLADAGVTDGSKINPLSSINTADIENIDVLKDASATAIYGSRGANGVVIITTKSGSKNKSSINYDGFIGTQEVIKTIPLLNAAEWWSLRKDAAANSGKTVSIPNITGYSLDTTGAGTDWQAAAFRKATQQSHNLSILSGSDKTRLAISGNYFKQNGILQNTDFRRYSARVNLDHNYSDRLRIYASLNASNTKANVAPNAIVGNLLQTPPSLPIYQTNGNFVVNSPFESALQNPINSLYNQLNETITNRFLGNVSGEYTILEGLKAKVLVGADVVGNKQNRYLPSTTAEGLALNGDAIVGSVFTTNWLNENTVSYDKDINDKNRINAVVGFTAQVSESKSTIAEAAGFATDAFGYNNLGTGITTIAPRSAASKWSLASYLGRINYVFDDRYLVTFTLRADGSSRFGAGNKWGYFPSAAVGWNLNNEKFFQQFQKISLLKLRLSAGTTGNQSIPPYQSLSQLAYFRYNFSNTTVSGYAPNSVPNPDLGWEKTFQVDGGLDIGLFKNRLNITFDYYYKRTSDLLLTRTVAGSSGLSDFYNGQASVVYQNIGEVSNQGVELFVNSQNTTGAFKWNTVFIFAKNSNKILSLGDGVDQIIPNISNPSIAKVGYPLGSFIVYKTDGIIQQGEAALTPQQNKNPGGQKYQDINGDGVITQAGDRVVVSNQPAFTTGLTNSFSYKGFDLTVFLQASIGGKLYNQNRALLELGTGYTNGSANLVDRWTPTNTDTDVKAAYQDPAATNSDRFVEDATYGRLKNISFGYNLPKTLLSKVGIEALKVYISAQNAITWTKYTGFDPEVSLNGQSLITKGIDQGVYPNNKSVQVGLSLSF